jgi:hypothetical protein
LHASDIFEADVQADATRQTACRLGEAHWAREPAPAPLSPAASTALILNPPKDEGGASTPNT